MRDELPENNLLNNNYVKHTFYIISSSFVTVCRVQEKNITHDDVHARLNLCYS